RPEEAALRPRPDPPPALPMRPGTTLHLRTASPHRAARVASSRALVNTARVAGRPAREASMRAALAFMLVAVIGMGLAIGCDKEPAKAAPPPAPAPPPPPPPAPQAAA